MTTTDTPRIETETPHRNGEGGGCSRAASCSPFWSDAQSEIFHGDAMEYLRAAPAKSVNVLITDPPFFTPASHYQSRVSWGRSWGDMSILGEFFFAFAVEAKRVLKDDGHLVCFCHDESYPVFYPVAFGMWDFTAALIWDRDDALMWIGNGIAQLESARAKIIAHKEKETNHE